MNLQKELSLAVSGLLLSTFVLTLVGIGVYSNRHAPATHKIRLM